MVLHGEKTFKTTIQKNLSKSQKFARKVTVAEFRYTQPIFLQFTVTLLIILKLMILWNFIWKLHIQSPVEQLRWSFFVENLVNYYSSKNLWGAFQHWGYTRESWTLPVSQFVWFTLNTKTIRWTHGLTPRPHFLE